MKLTLPLRAGRLGPQKELSCTAVEERGSIGATTLTWGACSATLETDEDQVLAAVVVRDDRDVVGLFLARLVEELQQ